jgi:predicted acetyltransferase
VSGFRLKFVPSLVSSFIGSPNLERPEGRMNVRNGLKTALMRFAGHCGADVSHERERANCKKFVKFWFRQIFGL